MVWTKNRVDHEASWSRSSVFLKRGYRSLKKVKDTVDISGVVHTIWTSEFQSNRRCNFIIDIDSWCEWKTVWILISWLHQSQLIWIFSVFKKRLWNCEESWAHSRFFRGSLHYMNFQISVKSMVHFNYWYGFVVWMKTVQISTVFKKRV